MTALATSRPTPVFVLGVQRSGTTWVANILAQHSRITAVQAEDHFGIHESIFFSHFALAYGDLDKEDNFQHFATDFTTSDYYLLSGLKSDWLTRARPRSYPDAFRSLMDEVARRRGVDLWVEKSPAHTALAEYLATTFPDARFVCVVRRAPGAIASQLWLDGHPPPHPARIRVLMRACLLRAQQRLLAQFCRSHGRCFLTKYENFAADSQGECRRMCDFLGIDYEPTMLELPWKRNTSFGSANRHRALSVPDRIIVATLNAVLALLPLSVLRSLIAWRRARSGSRHGGVDFPSWCWRRRDASMAPFRDSHTTPDPPGVPRGS